MGFTLGKNTYIINEPSQVDIITNGDGSGAEDMLIIPGVLKIQSDRVHNHKEMVKTDPAQGSLSFTALSAAQLGIEAPEQNESGVAVKFRLASTRTASEWSNNFIEMSRPIVLGITVNPGDSADTVAAAIGEALEAYGAEYLVGELPFETSVAGADITLAIKPGYEYLNFQSLVEYTVENETVRKTYGTIAKSDEGAYTGAQLEEFVRMSLNDTSDLYSIKAGQLPVLGAMYNYIEIVAKDDAHMGVDGNYVMHRGLGGTRDETANTRLHTFMLFFKEDSYEDPTVDPPTDPPTMVDGPVRLMYNEVAAWLANT